MKLIEAIQDFERHYPLWNGDNNFRPRAYVTGCTEAGVRCGITPEEAGQIEEFIENGKICIEDHTIRGVIDELNRVTLLNSLKFFVGLRRGTNPFFSEENVAAVESNNGGKYLSELSPTDLSRLISNIRKLITCLQQNKLPGHRTPPEIIAFYQSVLRIAESLPLQNFFTDILFGR